MVQRSVTSPDDTYRPDNNAVKYCICQQRDMPCCTFWRRLTPQLHDTGLRPYGDSVFFSNCSWEEGAEVPTATWTDDHP